MLNYTDQTNFFDENLFSEDELIKKLISKFMNQFSIDTQQAVRLAHEFYDLLIEFDSDLDKTSKIEIQ